MNRFLFIGFLMAGLFFSCTTDTTEPKIGDDSQLIKAIQEATNKQTISVDELPSASKNLLDDDYQDDIVDLSKIAPDLGYEIDLMRGKGSRLGDKMQVYFDLKGRKLVDRGGKGRGDGRGDKDKEECFYFVLPVTFIMPDGSTITVEEKEDWMLIKEWYLANPGVREKPSLEYPVDIKWKDGTIKTINNDGEMRLAFAYCDDGSGLEKCFDFVYPITYTMPDWSTITIDIREDWEEMKSWYRANPDVKEKPALQYPADIIFRDGTTATLKNDEDLRRAYAFCDK